MIQLTRADLLFVCLLFFLLGGYYVPQFMNYIN